MRDAGVLIGPHPATFRVSIHRVLGSECSACILDGII